VAPSGGRLTGNRLALVGTVMYFLEWVAIALIPSVPTDKLGRDPGAVVAAYGHPKAVGLAAGWFSVVLVGRVVFTIGLRDAFSGLRRERLFADVAVAAMALSVAIEVTSFGITSSAAWIKAAGGNQSTVVALDAASSTVYSLVFGPIGVSVVAGSIAMVLSRLFPRWLAWIGVFGGSLLILGGVSGAGGVGASGTFHDVTGILTDIPIPFVWFWMIATSVVLFRATKPAPSEPA
jgi:hypothetical protein